MNQLKKILIIGLILFIIPFLSSGQFTETKHIKKQYGVSPETRIEITNKYGKIRINTWEKDSIIFDIKIKVEEKKLSRLEKAMDGIDIDFIKSQHFIIARTKVGENRSGLEKELINFKESVLQSTGNVEIDYEIWMPETNQLKVENKFGDVYIDDYTGEIEINLSNGNLKSHDFEGKSTFTLSFADATINSVKDARLNCNYSDIYLKKADQLQITSKSSEFEIIEIDRIDADTRRDKFRIQMINTLDSRGSFSNYRITELNHKINMLAEYGDLDVEKIKAGFNSVYIESKSADINLSFSEKSSFGFEITHIKSETSLGKKMVVIKEDVLDEKEKKVKLTGNFGAEAKSTKLFINASGGGINVFSY